MRLSPQSVKSAAFSRKIVSNRVELYGTRLVLENCLVVWGKETNIEICVRIGSANT